MSIYVLAKSGQAWPGVARPGQRARHGQLMAGQARPGQAGLGVVCGLTELGLLWPHPGVSADLIIRLMRLPHNLAAFANRRFITIVEK